MFKKKENNIDIKKANKIIEEAENALIVLNEKRGYIEGTPFYVYNIGMNLIKNLLDNGVLNLSDIVSNFADSNDHVIKIRANDTEDAFKQIDKEVQKMKKEISKKIKKEKDDE